jgi:hypothetical protein
MDQRTIENLEELEIFEENKIIDLDKYLWLVYKDNLLHFVDLKKKILFSPSHSDLMNYDVIFGGLVGNEVAYQLIKSRVFYICEQQIHKEGETNKLDDIIKDLKNGIYGKIDESNFLFIDAYLYMVSNTFFLRDVVARKKLEMNKTEYDDNYGGRCVSLLSIKKVLIDGVSIEESILHFEQTRLGTTDLGIVMPKNGIPRNECLSKKKANDDAGW